MKQNNRAQGVQKQMDVAKIKLYAYAGFISSLVQPPDQNTVADASFSPFTQRQFDVFSNKSQVRDGLDIVMWVRYLRKCPIHSFIHTWCYCC
jgi:hypothetical protein